MKRSFQNWYENLDDKEKKQAIYKKACFYLSRREYSRKELLDKMIRKYGLESEELILEVLDFVQDKGWQSDKRFAESYVRSKAARGIGPRRINRELQQKGVDLKVSDLEVETPNFLEKAEEMVWKKYGKDLKNWEGMEYEEKYKLKGKIQRFLAYRGLPFIEIESLVAEKE